jgi:O-acetyl-ADP-ribose deacetylase
MDELRAKFQHCPTGSAVMTGAGNLSAKHVIHAVGPVWSGGDSGEEELLESAYTAAFRLAADHHLHTVALAAISTGIYRFPLQLAAPIAVNAAQQALREPGTSLTEVTWALFSQRAFDAFVIALDNLGLSALSR